MELDLSLGDLPSKASDGHTAAAVTTNAITTTTAAVNRSLGFCMTLGMNSSNGTSHHQHTDNPHAQDGDGDGGDDDDGDEYDNDDDDDVGEEHEKHDEQVLNHETGGIKDVSVGSQRVSSMNPPVQLDLLPSAPVLRHTPFLWCSHNGSSEGGSSGNEVAAGRRPSVMAGIEEATSSFRLDFMSYGRNGNGGSKNHRRGFEIGNDAVEGSSRASDEDDNGMSRKKLRLTKEQSAYLEESFKEHSTLNPKQKLALAEQLNLRPRQVEVWFQNRRARTKLKQTEVDYEYLKRCCETLTEENKRLHKELQELRALKTSSNPFYMQLPATTLTMCPSCERVATTSATALRPPSTTLTNTVDQNPKQAGKSSTLISPKPRSLILPVSQAPPPNKSHPHE